MVLKDLDIDGLRGLALQGQNMVREKGLDLIFLVSIDFLGDQLKSENELIEEEILGVGSFDKDQLDIGTREQGRLLLGERGLDKRGVFEKGVELFELEAGFRGGTIFGKYGLELVLKAEFAAFFLFFIKLFLSSFY
jgi:hypothetical protein